MPDRIWISALLAVACALVAAPARAHIDLLAPPARHAKDVLKGGPCGATGSERSSTPAYFEPGAEVTLVWDEYIAHPGHMRVMLSLDGDAFPDPKGYDDICDPAADSMCIADGIAGKSGGIYQYVFELPKVTCSNCTIQVIQVMTDKPPYGDGDDIYYDCADIVITNDPPPSSTGGAGEGGESGGCQLSRGGGASPRGLGIVAVALALARLAWRRRRSPGA